MYYFNFSKEVFISDCSIRRTLGIYCPGCGGTRAAKALLKGNILLSLKYNPIVFLLLVDCLLMILLERRNKCVYDKLRIIKFQIIFNIAFLAFIAIYSLFRNYLLLEKGIDLLGDFY